MSKIKFRNMLLLVLACLISISCFPIEAYAHEVYFLQVVVDENTHRYVGNAIRDDSKTEANHLEAKLYGITGQGELRYSFPQNGTSNITAEEINQVFKARDTLIPAINEMLNIMEVNNKSDFDDASSAIKNGGTFNGWNVSTSGGSTVISKGGAVYKFTSSMEIAGTNVTIGSLLAQAEYAKSKGITSSNASSISEPGVIEKKLSEFFQSVIDGIRSYFGVYTMDELVYNQGVRSKDLYFKGIMPKTWMQTATSFHLVFQAIAWSVLVFAMVKSLLQISIATINPMMKVRFYDGIRDLFMTGFLLVAALLLVNTLLTINEKIVDIFKTTIATSDSSFGNIASDTKNFAGVLIQIFYLFVTVYLNIIYIIRSISTAMLIAAAPIFIVSISFEGKNVLFTKWIREIIANIFVQSFHAFLFSMFLSIQFSARGLEQMVIAFAMIPLTEFFRGLISGESGSIAGSLGMGAIGAGVGMATAGASALVGNNRKPSTSGGNTSSKSTSGNLQGGDRYNPITAGNKDRAEHSADAPNNKTSSEALKQRPKATTVGTTDYNSLGEKDVKPAIKETAKSAGKFVTGAAVATAGIGASIITGGRSGDKLVESGIGSMKGGVVRGSQSFRNVKDINSHNSQAKPSGNILGIESTASGKTVVHRDRGKVNGNGLVNITSSGDSYGFTYDGSKMKATNKQRLDNIVDNYAGETNKVKMKEYGIDNIIKRNDGTITIQANREYLNRMGVEDIYQTENRIVETKRPGQQINTEIVPNIKFNPSASSNYRAPASN